MANKKKKRHIQVAEKLEKRRKKLRAERDKEKQKFAAYNKWPNGKLIYEMMKSNGVRGDVRDYVVLTPKSMLDYRGSYNVVYKEVGGEFGIFKMGGDVYLIHKRKLKNVIGEEASKKFWHPKIGRLVDVEEGTKPSVNKKKTKTRS